VLCLFLPNGVRRGPPAELSPANGRTSWPSQSAVANSTKYCRGVAASLESIDRCTNAVAHQQYFLPDDIGHGCNHDVRNPPHQRWFFWHAIPAQKKRDVHPLPCTRARKLPSRTRLLRRRPPSKVGEKSLPCLRAVAETKTIAMNHQHATIPSGVDLFCQHESTSGLKNRPNSKFGENCWNWVGPNFKNRRNYCSLYQNFRKG
jgi:hypothetical protein